jgi:hypothetical protein
MNTTYRGTLLFTGGWQLTGQEKLDWMRQRGFDMTKWN